MISCEVVNRPVPCMFYIAYILKLVVHGLNNRSFSEQNFVMWVHQRIFHVLLDFRNHMYVINEKLLEEVLADVPSVCEELSEELLREFAIFQRCPVIYVSRRKLPLYDFSHVIDYKMQLESVEPAHRTLPLAAHPFVVLCMCIRLIWHPLMNPANAIPSILLFFLKNAYLHCYENALWFRILLACRWCADG